MLYMKPFSVAGRRPGRSGLFLLCLACAAWPQAAAWSLNLRPVVADVAGGAAFSLPWQAGFLCIDGVPADGVTVFLREEYCDPYEWESCEFGTSGWIPAAAGPGTVDILLRRWTVQHRPTECDGPHSTVRQGAFTYVDAPLVDAMSPSAYSIGPDNRRVTLEGAGFPINRPAEVWVGDHQATNVEVSTQGHRLLFTPPPFPGGEYPLTVDVRVVTVGGGETVLEDAFTYDRLVPYVPPFSDNRVDAWRTPFYMQFRIENYLSGGEYRFFRDGQELSLRCQGTECPRGRENTFGVDVPPPYPPGDINLTIVGPDGGIAEYRSFARLVRTSPIHSADLNGDGVLSLSELLRVVQLYNANAYHCAPVPWLTEDGYRPGSGPVGGEDCRPHDSDLQTWDWRIDLSELMEAIQLYNFGAYTLCEDQVHFCPADT